MAPTGHESVAGRAAGRVRVSLGPFHPPGSNDLAKPNYAFQKRQRDLAKKQKKEAKRQRKAESAAVPAEAGAETSPPIDKPTP